MIEINPAYSNIRACTQSYFCSDVSFVAKHEIAHRAKVSQKTVNDQALPTTKPDDIQLLNLANYNLQGTGKAYQELISEGTLDVVNGHANTTLLDAIALKSE